MRLPLWALRWLHRNSLSRRKLHGGFLHTRLGDRLLDKALWRPTRNSLARAWVVGVPISMIPFLPLQSVFAIVLGFVFRANLLLCILLQFVSSPVTAPIQLPACFLSVSSSGAARPPPSGRSSAGTSGLT